MKNKLRRKEKETVLYTAHTHTHTHSSLTKHSTCGKVMHYVLFCLLKEIQSPVPELTEVQEQGNKSTSKENH